MPKFVEVISIIEHIEYLAAMHDCVVIPEWGAFIAHYTPAVISDDDDAVAPPQRQLVFNAEVNHNDGLLASSIVRREGVTFDEAVHTIAASVTIFRQLIAEGSELPMGHLGYFSAGPEGTMQFHPFSLGKVGWEFYGLCMLHFPTLAETNVVELHTEAPSSEKLTEAAPAAVVPIETDEEVEVEEPAAAYDEEQPTKKPSRLARLARIAAAAIVLLALTFVLTTPVAFNSGHEQQYASMSVPEIRKASEPAAAAKPEQKPAAKAQPVQKPAAAKPAQATAAPTQAALPQQQGRYILVVSTLTSQQQANAYLAMHPDLKGVAQVSKKGKKYLVYIDRSDDYGVLVRKALNGMPKGYGQGWVTKV